jgi:hypothetical protein
MGGTTGVSEAALFTFFILFVLLHCIIPYSLYLAAAAWGGSMGYALLQYPKPE